MKYTREDVKSLGTILGVWAHPDDEAFTSAGIMAAAVLNGQKVALITATNGEAGQSADDIKWPRSNLAEIRKAELEDTLNIIGITEHEWLGYSDGKLELAETSNVVSKLIKVINRIEPDTIITFDEDGLTGHSDHKTVYKWVSEALKDTEKKCRVVCARESSKLHNDHSAEFHERNNMYIRNHKPNPVDEDKVDVCFNLDEELSKIKRDCLSTHKSQTSRFMNNPKDKAYVDKLCDVECFNEMTKDLNRA